MKCVLRAEWFNWKGGGGPHNIQSSLCVSIVCEKQVCFAQLDPEKFGRILHGIPGSLSMLVVLLDSFYSGISHLVLGSKQFCLSFVEMGWQCHCD